MTRTIHLQSDSNAHDRPWRVAVEQGFFAAEGLDVVYHEDNPKGTDGRVKDFTRRWKETQLQQGALELYPVCEWGAIERVQQLGKGKIIGLDTTIRTGAIMVRRDCPVTTLNDLRNVPIAVTWHAGTFMRPSRRWKRPALRSMRSSWNTQTTVSKRCSVDAMKQQP